MYSIYTQEHVLGIGFSGTGTVLYTDIPQVKLYRFQSLMAQLYIINILNLTFLDLEPYQLSPT